MAVTKKKQDEKKKAPNPKILILDPSSVTSRTLSRKLEGLGCIVHSKGIAGHAFESVEEHKPDVILLELSFEDPSGFEICQAIVDDSKLCNIPVIIHTNRSTRRNVIRSVQSGAKSVIVKPASTETIVTKIHALFVKLGSGDTFESQLAALTDSSKRRHPGSAGGKDANESAAVIFTEKMDADAKLKALLRNAKEVKAMPFGVARTLQVSQDEDSGAGDLGEVIESDTAISTMVLKRANSAHFTGQKRTVKVRDAIVRIGFGETRNLVLGISIVKNFKKDTRSLGFQRGAFWEHSLAVGAIARTLARQSNVVDPDLAFVAGLIHDVGKLIFDEYMSDEFEKAIEASGTKGVRLARAEREVFEINHTEVGQALLDGWRFPDMMSAVALYHNSYSAIESNVDAEYRPMVKLVYAANALAKAYRLGNSGDEMIYPVADSLMQELKLGDGLPDDLAATAASSIKEYRDFLGVPPSEDATEHRAEFDDKRLILLQDAAPLVDTCEFYLSQNWGFDVQRVADMDALDEIDDLEEAIVVLQAKDTSEDRGKHDKLFSNPFRGPVLILLEPGPRQAGQSDVVWPTDHALALKTPVEGRSLIAALSHMCQEAKEGTPKQSAA